MIHVMAQDPDVEVRESAGVWMSLFITSNGAETCNSVGPISQHVDELLLGLDDNRTAQSVAEILGTRDAGGTPLTCCMTTHLRKHVVTALEARNQSQGSGYTSAVLRNIEECPVEKSSITDKGN